MAAAFHVTVKRRSRKSWLRKLWLRSDRRRVFGGGYDPRGAPYGDIFQDMHATCGRGQLDFALFVIDRDNMPKLHRHQAAGGGFERDPAHLAPREIISLM